MRSHPLALEGWPSCNKVWMIDGHHCCLHSWRRLMNFSHNNHMIEEMRPLWSGDAKQQGYNAAKIAQPARERLSGMKGYGV